MRQISESKPGPEQMDSASTAPALPDSNETTCWQAIGVFGDNSCPDLKCQLHCRHCPEFANASRAVLAGPLPDCYREERTELFSRHEALPEVAANCVLLFRIGREWLALSAEILQEVGEKRPIHSLPHRRSGVVLGLANVRGEILICASLAALMDSHAALPPQALRLQYHRLLVVDWHGLRLGLPVDEVPGIHRMHPQELKPPPMTLRQAAQSYTQGVFYWKETPVGLLNADTVFATLSQCLK